ncbi:MAG: GIY-YIG nuclease family protein [Candidatus Thorarchaeota archaeon]|nr:MAG: GIY-YIG nuclease family protein [Candidatus Thorarchaeota archaeon]
MNQYCAKGRRSSWLGVTLLQTSGTDTMKGVYALIISLDKITSIKAGSLGSMAIQDGTWVYVGSAMGNGSTSLENRIRRHLTAEKAIHWHIDYLLEKASVVRALYSETQNRQECVLASAIFNSGHFALGPKGFGSSDCHSSCGSHLFLYEGSLQIEEVLLNAFRSIGLQPKNWIV